MVAGSLHHTSDAKGLKIQWLSFFSEVAEEEMKLQPLIVFHYTWTQLISVYVVWEVVEFYFPSAKTSGYLVYFPFMG